MEFSGWLGCENKGKEGYANMTRDFLIILHSYLYQFVKVHTSASISDAYDQVQRF